MKINAALGDTKSILLEDDESKKSSSFGQQTKSTEMVSLSSAPLLHCNLVTTLKLEHIQLDIVSQSGLSTSGL